jgi:putative endonuclease
VLGVFFVYIVECRDKTYYCGYTANLKKRIEAHNENKGAKYTRGRIPVRLVYYERFLTRSSALKREAEIKSFSRKVKQGLFFQGN